MLQQKSYRLVYRHRLPTRLLHWLNALCVFVLLMSGANILMAHPQLYWGQSGNIHDRPWLTIGARSSPQGLQGVTTIAGFEFKTTGVLGVSGGQDRTLPSWATLPSYRDLATARRWHFFFAWMFVINGLLYLAISFANGHVRRDLLPTKTQLAPRHILADIWNHMRLKFPHGEEALSYNVLQKLAYMSVIFGLLPLMLLTGLSMSPGFNAIAPVLLDVFGGRQSARTLHFLAASGVLLFIIVHLVMVLLAGPWNEIRSMITGNFRVQTKG
jgi:thiosulfate reductase cytochrome b subunit